MFVYQIKIDNSLWCKTSKNLNHTSYNKHSARHFSKWSFKVAKTFNLNINSNKFRKPFNRCLLFIMETAQGKRFFVIFLQFVPLHKYLRFTPVFDTLARAERIIRVAHFKHLWFFFHFETVFINVYTTCIMKVIFWLRKYYR